MPHYLPPGTAQCGYPRCYDVAVPGRAPNLCASHHDSHVLCPTCADWLIRRRRYCETCRGREYVTHARAAWARDVNARSPDYEEERRRAAGLTVDASDDLDDLDVGGTS